VNLETDASEQADTSIIQRIKTEQIEPVEMLEFNIKEEEFFLDQYDNKLEFSKRIISP
jgi:hypothetical protein